MKVDLDIAIKQHNLLQEALISAGLDLIELPSDGYPDSVFVEDTAVVVGKKVEMYQETDLIKYSIRFSYFIKNIITIQFKLIRC